MALIVIPQSNLNGLFDNEHFTILVSLSSRLCKYKVFHKTGIYLSLDWTVHIICLKMKMQLKSFLQIISLILLLWTGIKKWAICVVFFHIYYVISSMSWVVWHMSHVVCYMRLVICFMWYRIVICIMSYVICHYMTCIVCHMSYVVRHMLYVICSMSYVCGECRVR